MKNLHEYYDELLNLRFPGSDIGDDDLAEFYAELVEVDSYYAGLIKGMLGADFKDRKKIDFIHLKNLRKQLDEVNTSSLSESDKNKFKEFNNYLSFLEILPSVVG